MNYNSRENTKIVIFILLGTFGFGAGGAIGGAIWFAFDAPHIGFAILGAVGGASLGAALGGWKKVWVLAFASAIGFDIGLLMGFFIPLAIWEPSSGQSFLIGTVGGTIGGTSIGIALKNWKKTVFLALASGIGLSIAVWITWDTLRGFTPQILGGALTLAIWGASGGVFLGLTLGVLEKRKQK